MTKLLVGWQATEEDLARIRSRLPDCELLITRRRPDLQYFEADLPSLDRLLAQAQILMGWIAPRDAIERASRLKMISWLHAGCDQLDYQQLHRKNIVLTKVAGSNAPAVAEQAFAFLLALARRIPQNHALVTESRWRPLLDPETVSMELRGSVLAIIGLGRIGEEIARRAKAFDMKVIATKCDTSRHDGVADKVYPAPDLCSVVSRAKFVVLAVPLTIRTLNMINEEVLRAMQPSSYLINICRGAVVQEAALHRALSEAWIRGYASDVWWDYPDSMPPAYHYNVPSRMGVHLLPNVLCSGDRASNILSVKDRMIESGIQNIEAYLRGVNPALQVDLVREY